MRNSCGKIKHLIKETFKNQTLKINKTLIVIYEGLLFVTVQINDLPCILSIITES